MAMCVQMCVDVCYPDRAKMTHVGKYRTTMGRLFSAIRATKDWFSCRNHGTGAVCKTATCTAVN
jgi:hypothetical protein